METGAQQKGSL